MPACRTYSQEELLKMLDAVLLKEAQFWMPKNMACPPVEEVGPKELNDIINWMAKVNKRLGFQPETFCLAANILDRFLNIVKARIKHLQVIGVACIFVSAKVVEEDENIPETVEIVRKSQCGCSVAEVVRMERLVLDKLGWDFPRFTSLDFLNILYSLLAAYKPDLYGGTADQTANKLSRLTSKLIHCLCCQDFLAYKPSVLALSLLSVDLENICVDWFNLTVALQQRIKASDPSLMLCRDRLGAHFTGRITARPPRWRRKRCALVPLCSSLPYPCSSFKMGKRKSHMDLDEDEVFDAIKQLYSSEDDVTPRRQISRVGCRPKLRSSQSVPAALQAVAM